MKLTSAAIERERRLPVRYSRDGENLSPSLEWSDIPPGTRELALIVENVTSQAPEPFVHWLVGKIPANVRSLPEGYMHKRTPGAALQFVQGLNSLGKARYDGPLGVTEHALRLRLRLLALDEPVDMTEATDRRRFLSAIEGHVLAEAELPVEHRRP